MKTVIKNFLPLASVPMGLLFLAFLLFSRLETLSPPLVELLPKVSYFIFFIGLVLSWWFNRSRVFFVIIILSLSQFLLTSFVPLGTNKEFYLKVVYSVLCLIIPTSILIFSFLKERGIITFWGLTRIGFILLQLGFIFSIVNSNDKEMVRLLNKQVFFELPLSAITPLSQIGLLWFIIAFSAILLKYLTQKSYLDNSFLGVLLFSFLALHFKESSWAPTIFFPAAGILLVIAIIQTSYSMAYLDELTGLPSRRALKEEMLKLSGKYVIAMLDIDFFKKFNDKYGHDVGDEVLKLVASCMEKVTGGGKPFRYGGEEFTILFPGKKLPDAVPHLEKLRVSIAQKAYNYQGNQGESSKQLFVTASIGVAEKNDKYKTFDEVLKGADDALYRAKKKGRNQVSK